MNKQEDVECLKTVSLEKSFPTFAKSANVPNVIFIANVSAQRKTRIDGRKKNSKSTIPYFEGTYKKKTAGLSMKAVLSERKTYEEKSTKPDTEDSSLCIIVLYHGKPDGNRRGSAYGRSGYIYVSYGRI